MSLRKYGTGEILPEEGDLQKQATAQDKDQTLAEVQAEALDADHEEQ